MTRSNAVSLQTFRLWDPWLSAHLPVNKVFLPPYKPPYISPTRLQDDFDSLRCLKRLWRQKETGLSVSNCYTVFFCILFFLFHLRSYLLTFNS